MNASFTASLLAIALLGNGVLKEDTSAYPSDPIGPLITFDTLVHDYGTIAFGADGRCAFRFTNTGDAPLIISQFQSSCGCLVPSWDQDPVLPGASGSVRLKYDTRRAGPINKSATLQSNAANTPVVVLRIKGMVLADTAAHQVPMTR